MELTWGGALDHGGIQIQCNSHPTTHCPLSKLGIIQSSVLIGCCTLAWFCAREGTRPV
ncbi:hypothetical protein BS47DRAFT_1341854 [Hydnum rufescens UP504]|uniref:Uncharacterized protein n=1 Tax=Hydnum rufescens UP504 TaxID=1448309 RepID=A0A9P6B114_9AGAM|nr:hypothetical protein BS47DRAFT_1341854 [Hydnum rufescens UP504]